MANPIVVESTQGTNDVIGNSKEARMSGSARTVGDKSVQSISQREKHAETPSLIVIPDTQSERASALSSFNKDGAQLDLSHTFRGLIHFKLDLVNLTMIYLIGHRPHYYGK